MLERRALDAERDLLRLRVLELRLGRHHIGLCGEPGVELVAHDLERLLVGGDGVIEHALLLVGDAELEIVARKRRLVGEPRCGEVRGRRLGGGDVGLDGAADAAPDIGDPAHRRRDRELVLRDAAAAAPAAAARWRTALERAELLERCAPAVALTVGK